MTSIGTCAGVNTCCRDAELSRDRMRVVVLPALVSGKCRANCHELSAKTTCEGSLVLCIILTLVAHVLVNKFSTFALLLLTV